LAFQHELHQASNPIPLPVLGCPEDSLSQVPNLLSDALPLEARPLVKFLGSDFLLESIFHLGLVPLLRFFLWEPAESLPSFDVGQIWNPYLEHYPKLSLSSASFTL
jgi:hypothetical protein